jgi:hypothetical protein
LADNSSVLQSFLVEVGFGANSSDAAKVQEAVKKVEAAITFTVQSENTKRLEADKKAADQRADIASSLQTLVTQGEKQAANKREKDKEEEDARNKRRDAEKSKREQQQRDRDLKATQEFNRKIAESAVSAINTIKNVLGAEAIYGAARNILSVTDQAAKNFERLGYMSSRVGASARGISAFGYAASQTGSSASEADAGLEGFSRNLRMNQQGRVSQLRDLLGVNARGRDGRMRDSTEILEDVGDSLRERSKTPQGYAQATVIAQALGISETLMRSITSPEFRKYVDQFRKDNSVAGADQDAAAKSGAVFEQGIRHVIDIVEAVKTRVETGLFNLVAPQLEKIAKWIDDHSVQISGFIDSLAKGLIDLGTAFVNSDVVRDALKSLGDGLEWTAKYVSSDDFKKDMKDLGTGIMNLAKAVRKALEFLGILPASSGPTSAERAAADSDSQADVIHNNQGVFGNAMVRGHRGGLFHTLQNQADEGKVRGRLEQFRGTGSFGKKGWWTPDRQGHAIDRLMKEAGLSEDGAKALVSRWMFVESAGGPESVNPKSGAEGIAQWLGSRKGNGSRGSYDNQLSKVIGELNGPEALAKRLLNTKGREAEGASAYERAEGYAKGANAGTHRDNFTDRVAEGMKHVVHGAPSKPATVYVDGVPSSDQNAPASSGVPTREQFQAADARKMALQRPGHKMTQEEHDQLVEDNKTTDAYLAAHRGEAGPMDPGKGPIMDRGKEVVPGPEVRGAARGNHDSDPVESRTIGRYLGVAKPMAAEGKLPYPHGHVPLSDAQQKLKDAMEEDMRRKANDLKSGSGSGSVPSLTRPLGSSSSISNSALHVSQANSYYLNAHKEDMKTLMGQTEVHASRGMQDLLRNTRGVEA